MEHKNNSQTLSERFENKRNCFSSISVPKMRFIQQNRSFPRPEFKIYKTRYEMSDDELKNVLDDELDEYMFITHTFYSNMLYNELDNYMFNSNMLENNLPLVNTSNEGRKTRLLDIEIENYFKRENN